MTLPDMFPGFDTQVIKTSDAEIYTRIGGEGPPLLFLHGYPQTHVMWHKIVPELAKTHRCILMDLRGYGQSSVPDTTDDHYSYSKRAMGIDAKEAMASLGYDRFSVVSHDRGSRVAYRMALDFPDLIEKLVILDIVPTWVMWHRLSPSLAIKSFHWTFMAQASPLPEEMIGADPLGWFNRLGSWSKGGDVSVFDPRALEHYRSFFVQPERLKATIEDYRAGATYDLKADEEDRAAGNKIKCPVLVLWGTAGIPSANSGASDPTLDIWREWADDVSGHAIESGHFLAEEAPEGVLGAVVGFV